MDYFLCFFVDDYARTDIVDKVDQISPVFSDMGIDVRWINSSNYHIKLQNLGGNINLFSQVYISKKVKEVFNKEVQFSIGRVKVGTKRNFKGLIYLEIDKGADTLRELRYEMLKTMKIKDNVKFVPHIALGRINKDLSNQENSNIVKNIVNICSIDSREYDLKEIVLVKINKGNYEVLKNFPTCS